MLDTSSLLVALILARRAGDERAANEALTRLRQCGYRLTPGSALPPRRSRPAAEVPPRANT